MKLKNNNLETDSPVARIEETKNNAVSESRPDDIHVSICCKASYKIDREKNEGTFTPICTKWNKDCDVINNPSPQTSIEASMAERTRPSEGKHDVPRALGVDATDTFSARIKETVKISREGAPHSSSIARNHIFGMKEALEAVTKILDKSFIEMERELEAQIDNDVEGVFEDNPRALEILPIVHEEIKKQITAWLEELK